MSEQIELEARMAEAMGWEYRKYPGGDPRYLAPDGTLWFMRDLSGWVFYGIVDQFMRERGYTKHLEGPMPIYDGAFRVTWHDSNGQLRGVAAATDEPHAAIEAALKALEETNE